LEGITFAKDFLFVGLFVCFFLNENETKGSSEGFYQPFLRFQLPFQEFARSASFLTNCPTRQFVETRRLRYRRQNLGQRNFTSGPRRAPLGLLVPIFPVISSSHSDKLPLGLKGWVARGEGYGDNGNHDGVRRR